jgi:hypothetical protein
MSTNIKTAVVVGGTGSGILVDINSSVTLNDTNRYEDVKRILGFSYSVAADGDFLVTGDKNVPDITGVGGGSVGTVTRIHAVSGGSEGPMLPYSGFAVRGVIKVSAPASAAKLTAYYE